MVETEIWDLFLKFLTFTALAAVKSFSRLSRFSRIFSKKLFLLKMTQNRSIHEKKWLKLIFENFSFFLCTRGPRLVIFLQFLKMKSCSILSLLAGQICLLLQILMVLIPFNCLKTIYLARWHCYAKRG